MNIVLVGSGASAVHFAKSALERGHAVTMLDVGREPPAPVNPQDGFEDLKSNLEDPVAHFLGEDFQAVVYPGGDGEYYGLPPNKQYVFEGMDPFALRSTGFSPLTSFAQGGLAEAWTAGAFPFHAGETTDFPLEFADLERFYDRIADRIGISGARDDLSELFPVPETMMPALDMDESSRSLLDAYGRKRDDLARLGFVMGRSRVATLSADRNGRSGCDYLGRCLIGCPIESLYTPIVTLRDCRKHENFRYRAGLCVHHFKFDVRRLTSVVAERVDGGGREEFPVERLVLGAGTLASSKIFLESWWRGHGELLRLTGLMDNRQILLPFLNLRMIRRQHDPRTYQYHQLLLGMRAEDPRDYVHGIMTTLKTASIHPVVQSIPFDVPTALHVFRNVHSALGLVNVNFPDTRRDGCYLTLDIGASGPEEGTTPPLRVHYEPPAGEERKIKDTLGRFNKALGKLGCFAPPGMEHVRPMGASVHYAGTIPMTREDRPFTTTPEGRSREFDNLWFCDGTTFPFLPAKNLTLTLMANAARIAETAF
jgi:choline dehydrogenase-like flavoprotein